MLAYIQLRSPCSVIVTRATGDAVLDEAMVALASAGGTAVVQAAGTDAWRVFREKVVRLFGRQGSQGEQTALERLNETAAALEATGDGEAEKGMSRYAARWHEWFAELLDGLDGSEQYRAADELRQLVSEATRAQRWEQHIISDGNGLAVGVQGAHSSVHIHHHGLPSTRGDRAAED
jgi:hypothetical protein